MHVSLAKWHIGQFKPELSLYRFKRRPFVEEKHHPDEEGSKLDTLGLMRKIQSVEIPLGFIRWTTHFLTNRQMVQLRNGYYWSPVQQRRTWRYNEWWTTLKLVEKMIRLLSCNRNPNANPDPNLTLTLTITLTLTRSPCFRSVAESPIFHYALPKLLSDDSI